MRKRLQPLCWAYQITVFVARYHSFGSLRWLNTVFDTCVSFTFFSKTVDPSVAKNGSKQVNNTNVVFLMVKLTYVPLP